MTNYKNPPSNDWKIAPKINVKIGFIFDVTITRKGVSKMSS